MAKLISDLKIGDKVFVIDKFDRTFDVAEVIGIFNMLIKLQSYFSNRTSYLWRYLFTRYDSNYKIIFTDENEAIEEFKFILKDN